MRCYLPQTTGRKITANTPGQFLLNRKDPIKMGNSNLQPAAGFGTAREPEQFPFCWVGEGALEEDEERDSYPMWSRSLL